MADRDEEYVPEGEIAIELKQEVGPKKSKVHFHTTILTDAATGKQKLSCNYCLKHLVATQAVLFNILELVTLTFMKLSVIFWKILRSTCPKLTQKDQ